MSCSCGFSTDYPKCNGTHKIVKSVKNKIIAEIEAIDISDGKLNALGMKMLVTEAVKKVKGV
jgi:CDGSH-type Zn-finger protein